MSDRQERARWLRQIVETWVANNPFGDPQDLLRAIRNAGFINTTVSSLPTLLHQPSDNPTPRRTRITGVVIIHLPTDGFSTPPDAR